MAVMLNKPAFEFIQPTKECRELLYYGLRLLLDSTFEHTCHKNFLMNIKPAAHLQQIAHSTTFLREYCGIDVLL